MSATTAPQQQQPQPRTLDLSALSLEQLGQVRQQLEAELGTLGGSVEKLVEAGARYARSVAAVDAVVQARRQPQQQQNQLFIPLAPSLYARGTHAPDARLTVDLGAGFFARLEPEDAKEAVQRKLDYVKKNLASFKAQHAAKRKTLEAVLAMQRRRVQERMQAQEAEAAAAGAVPAPPAAR